MSYWLLTIVCPEHGTLDRYSVGPCDRVDAEHSVTAAKCIEKALHWNCKESPTSSLEELAEQPALNAGTGITAFDTRSYRE